MAPQVWGAGVLTRTGGSGMLAASGTYLAQPWSSLWWRPGQQKGLLI